MASPRVAKMFPAPQFAAPGQGENRALEALSDAADRQVQRDQTTAQMQAEAMRSNTEAAKMMIAGAQDLASGITNAAEAYSTQQQVKQQRAYVAGEKKKERDALASREKTQQAADLERQESINRTTSVNKEAEQAFATSTREANVKEAKMIKMENKRQVQNVELLRQLSTGEGFPEDPGKRQDHVDNIIRAVKDNYKVSGEAGYGQDEVTLNRVLDIAGTGSLGTRQNAQTMARKVTQRAEAEQRREQAVEVYKAALPHQTLAFANQKAYLLVDPGLEAGIPAADQALQLFQHLSQADFSKVQGVGIVRALAENRGKPPGQLNQVASRLGPNGMAATDALVATVQNWAALLEEENPATTDEQRDYRHAVFTDAMMLAQSLRHLPSFNALQLGHAADSYQVSYDNFRSQYGRPPNAQEDQNMRRGLDFGHMPGGMDMSKMYPPIESSEADPAGTSYGLPISGAASSPPQMQAEALKPTQGRTYSSGFDVTGFPN